MRAFFKGFLIGLCIGFCILGALFFYYFKTRQAGSAPAAEAVTEPPENDIPENPPEETDPLPEDPESLPEEEPVFAPPESDAEGTAPDASADKPAEQEMNTAVLAFAGDVMFSEQYLASYDQNGISTFVDTDMLSEMQDADLFLLNEEFPFSLRGEAMEDKQFTFRTDPKYIQIFQELGADIVTVANNHALDFGTEAFCDTLDTLRQAGITCIGGGYNISEAASPAVQTVGGQTFAVFGATRVSPSYDWYATDNHPGLFQTYDPAKLNAAISMAKQAYDHVIVFVHWGIEKSETPEEYQRQLARGYIDAGADLIVGCHPHVLQGFEYYNDVPIVYSLGNYLFGNRTGETLLLKAIFSADGSPDIQLVPCQRVNGVLTRIQEPSSLYQHLTSLSFGVSITEDGRLVP